MLKPCFTAWFNVRTSQVTTLGGWGRVGLSRRAPGAKASEPGTSPFRARPQPPTSCDRGVNHACTSRTFAKPPLKRTAGSRDKAAGSTTRSALYCPSSANHQKLRFSRFQRHSVISKQLMLCAADTASAQASVFWLEVSRTPGIIASSDGRKESPFAPRRTTLRPTDLEPAAGLPVGSFRVVPETLGVFRAYAECPWAHQSPGPPNCPAKSVTSVTSVTALRCKDLRRRIRTRKRHIMRHRDPRSSAWFKRGSHIWCGWGQARQGDAPRSRLANRGRPGYRQFDPSQPAFCHPCGAGVEPCPRRAQARELFAQGARHNRQGQQDPY